MKVELDTNLVDVTVVKPGKLCHSDSAISTYIFLEFVFPFFALIKY